MSYNKKDQLVELVKDCLKQIKSLAEAPDL